MKTKKITFLLVFLSLFAGVFAQKADKQGKKGEKVFYVKIETSYGDMVVKLYNETPLHRDNFVKLVKEGTYDDLLFHRVIGNFMIQGGDPNSRNAKPGQMLGDGQLGYTIPAEFVPGLFHKKGALAAARQGDEVNPEKASSSCQFYIVQGDLWDEGRLKMVEQRYGKSFTPEQAQVYATVGGTPFLDGDYTVFGEVVEGMEVIDAIAAVQTDRMNRPIKDVKMKMYLIEK
ncbi:MAG: peptidylprolyl isomerase [Bacteroidales bacterium]|nr:peptidylprolyl isomerase [Candidatus Colimorpha merdihippi]MCQ2282218.1 peptidylprolyl isomerase [Bacteroidales bacterium]